MSEIASKYDALASKYPELVGNNRFGGFCVGDGWFNIIDTLCGMITWRVTQHNEDVAYRWEQINAGKTTADKYSEALLQPFVMPRIRQIKEKFGTLRFYIDTDDKKIQAWADFAEALSARTCEECGAPGEVRHSSGWVHTMCDIHEAEYLKKLAEEGKGY